MEKLYHMKVKDELPDEMYAYDEKCRKLHCLVSLVYNQLFKWVEETNDEEKVFTLLFLGNKLLAAFLSCREVFETRGQIIRDENCTQFERLVCETDNGLPDISCFMKDADNVLKRVMEDNPQLLDIGKKRLLIRFREASEWMAEISEKKDIMRSMHDKCREKRLHYNPEEFGIPADGFKQQAYSVLYSLTLLTTPSLYGAGTDVFVNLYKNSFGLFCSSAHCKATLDICKLETEDMFADNEADTNTRKIEILKRLRLEEKDGIRSFLAPFDIKYTNTRCDTSIGKLGRDLYHHLNAGEDSGVKKMSNRDLCKYFAMEARLRFLDDEIERLKSTEEDPYSGKDFFAENVSREAIHHAIYDTIREKHETRDGSRFILGAKSHWLAIYKVMERYDISRGTMSRFAELMNEWFHETAPTPCVYRSMISATAEDVKRKPYPEWPLENKINAPYRRVAELFIKKLREYGIIS